jgi:inner membrane protein
MYPLSGVVEALFGHRGWWHSLAGLAACTVLAWFIHRDAPAWVGLGFASHLALDALTPEGVRPVPGVRWRLYGPFRTGGVVDRLLLLLAVLFIVLRTSGGWW